MSLVRIFKSLRLYLLAVPIAIFYSGGALNQCVMAANGGSFPVMINELQAKDFTSDESHVRMTEKTRLNWLADYINLHTEIDSPGDILVGIGSSLLSYAPTVWLTLLVSDVLGQVRARGNRERGPIYRPAGGSLGSPQVWGHAPFAY